MAAITSQTFHPTPVLSIPRGARVAAEAFYSLLSGLTRLSARAVTAPVRGTRRTEAEQVRELARRYQQTDPGFAADLYAAAARHEGLAD